MSIFLEQFEYIKNQLTYIKSKVALDNQLGLYDINKISEDMFMHMLNDVYDLNLKNANDILHENFPAIDLVDEVNKQVIQVTSTTTLGKVKKSLKKFNELKSHQITDSTENTLKNSILKFRSFPDYEEYKIYFFYINTKPNIGTESWKKFLLDENLDSNNFIGIDDILSIAQSNPEICQKVYKTMQQRIDNLSFSFNIEAYFNKFETQIENSTSNKFKQYEVVFRDFIQSQKQVFEIHAVGGNGKSHLLKYLALIETEYIPLIFTKQVNIEEDLIKLSDEKKYLLIFDDIDRFLDTSILISLLSYTLNNPNTKLLLSYRTASKNIIQSVYRKYPKIKKEELEIIWKQSEIDELIKLLSPDISDENISKLSHTFNNNPYLIAQAINGDIESIKDFSKKIIDDAQIGLKEFGLNESAIKEILFTLSLITPVSDREIEKYFDKAIIQKLEDAKILRKLASKYRFNPDIQGDLYLANYIDENKDTFEEKIKEILHIFSDVIFTNLGYALSYNKSDSLQTFIKNIISKWDSQKEYKSDYLVLINKVVYYAPVESFVYLQNKTKHSIPKENEHIRGQLTDLVTKVTDYGDFNTEGTAINLGSIEPIVSKLIDILKNNTDVDGLDVKHIIKYLSSDLVLNLPKPYYDNHTLESIFKKIVTPLHTSNFDVIYSALEILEGWLDEKPINLKKINLLQKVIQSLLGATFENNSSDGFTYTFGQIPLNLKHSGVLKIIDDSKNILMKMFDSLNSEILSYAIDSVSSIGGRYREAIPEENIKFYSDLKKIFLSKIIDILPTQSDFFIISKIEELAINIINFHVEKDEALLILATIKRTNEYILYQIVKGVDFLIIDYDKFYTKYLEQKNVKDWMFDEVYKKHHEELNEDELKVIKSLNEKYKTSEQLIELINILDMSSWNSPTSLMSILNEWFRLDDDLLIKVCKNNLHAIRNEIAVNVLKEFNLVNGIREIKAEDIDAETSIDDLIIYINSIFKSYHTDRLDVLNRIVEIVEEKDKTEIRRFIAIISQKMYFTIAHNVDSYVDFEKIINKFLEWQLRYKFNIESYITYHILKAIKVKYGISESIKEKLDLIIRDNEIYIQEHDLKAIYKSMEYGLKELVEILYHKLISKKDDGTYRHYFSYYFDHDKITESLLVKEYVHTYEDFEYLINKTFDYYIGFTDFVTGKDGEKRPIKINLDYFLKYSLNQEFIEHFFNDLIVKNDFEKIKIFYSIIPVSSNYLEIIIKIINLLSDHVDEDKLINYITQVGKIKTYSRAPMTNSHELLGEDALLGKLYDGIDSISLQLKIKSYLEYIEKMKQHEIEKDIEFLLGKE